MTVTANDYSNKYSQQWQSTIFRPQWQSNNYCQQWQSTIISVNTYSQQLPSITVNNYSQKLIELKFIEKEMPREAIPDCEQLKHKEKCEAKTDLTDTTTNNT